MKYNFLVTGGAGFIGSNTVDFLIDEGHDVVIIDNLSTGKIDNVNPSAKFFQVDLSEKNRIDSLTKLVKDWEIDYVIHMAATPNVQQSIDDPITTNENNLLTTLNLLEIIKDTQVKKIVFSSTSAIYGETDNLPTDESTKVNPLSPYGLQKYLSERYMELYSKIFGVKGVCLRYFNVFGERMTNEGAYKSVISIFREQKRNNEPLTITNDGNQRRDFVYVKDIVMANYLSCLKETGDFQVFNVGSGTNISVNEIARFFNQETKFIGNRIEPFETLCSTNKIENTLGWKPSTELKSWIEKNVN